MLHPTQEMKDQRIRDALLKIYVYICIHVIWDAPQHAGSWLSESVYLWNPGRFHVVSARNPAERMRRTVKYRSLLESSQSTDTNR